MTSSDKSLLADSLTKALDVLRSGGIILYPTDTVWGIGCDALNESAVKKIYEIKKRIDSKSMLILVDSIAKLQAYVDDVPEMAWDLIEISEKPLTIIYEGAKNLASNLISGDGTIGIRVTKEAFSKSLCERFKKPIVSTSANISGQAAPSCFYEITEELKSAVDYVVEYNRNDKTPAKPSSIIKLTKGNVISIIRE
jgi:L-threonylcarbamoyladenylate synthase